MRRLLVGTIASLLILTAAGPAVGQGYPPPFQTTTTTIQQGGGGVGVSTTTTAPPTTSTTVPSSTTTSTPTSTTTTTTGTRDGGTVRPGRTVVYEFCGFARRSLVHVVANGVDVGDKRADFNGCIHVRILVVTQRLGLVEDPVRVELKPNDNVVVATGRNSAGTLVTQTVSFRVQAITRGGGEGRGPGGGGRGSGGRMAFTGANLVRWGTVASVLFLIGAAILVADRRRARRAQR